MNELILPEFTDIRAAHNRIKPFIHHTPVFTSQAINEISGSVIYFKAENLQKVGAFKFRGATNAVLCLSKEQSFRGVATHSSGNHAAALALAAKMQGIQANIVMPENAPEIKKKAVAGYGGKITFCKPTLEARESTLAQIVAQTGATEIHPYNNFQVICGQGTAAKELLEQYPDIEIIMPPVGGGGLLSGTAISSKALKPEILVFAAEPENANDAFKSLQCGYIVPSHSPKTIADGLLTSLGSLTFAIINQKVDRILTCSEKAIIEAMQLIWERMKIIAEPSSAVPLAVILENPEYFRGKKTGIILSGGNVELGEFFRQLPRF